MVQFLFVSMISFMCLSVTLLIAMSIALIHSLSKAKHVSHEDQSVSWFRRLKIRTKLKWIIYSLIGLFVSGGGAFFVTHFSPWNTLIYLSFVVFVASIILFVSAVRKVSQSSGNVLSFRHYLCANVVGASSVVALDGGPSCLDRKWTK